MTLSIPSPQAQQNDVARSFSVAVQATETYRICKNRIRKLISRQFWTYLSFLPSSTLSQENWLENGNTDSRGFATF
jgi:hypothetical protein